MTPEELNNIYAAEREFWWYAGMRAIIDAVGKPLLGGRKGTGLDAGCGTGYNALEIEREHGLRMFGVDLTPLAIEYCHRKSFLRALAASVAALPFGAANFDLVTSFDVLSHLAPGDEEGALAEFARVLRPEGWLILRVPAFRALRSRHSEFIAERQRFRAGTLLQTISQHGLVVKRWTYANSFLSPVALVKFRVIEQLRRAAPHSGVETMPPAWMNSLLTRVLLLEAAMIRRGFRFSFGQSLIVVAQKVAQKPPSSQNGKGSAMRDTK